MCCRDFYVLRNHTQLKFVLSKYIFLDWYVILKLNKIFFYFLRFNKRIGQKQKSRFKIRTQKESKSH